MKDCSFTHEYTILGDHTVLHIPYRDEGIKDVYIDTEDLEKVKKYNWYIDHRCQRDGYYVCYTQYMGSYDGNPRYKKLLLHRYLLNPKKDELIDHINHNTLDFRKHNLRKTVHNLNLKNRSGKNKNNTSGYRNVSWIENGQLWRVQLMIDGKNTKLKDFPVDQVHEAGKYAKEMREKIYGEFAGKS